MKKILFLISILWLSIFSIAQPPDGYYDDAQGLTGADLLEALRQIITNGHTANSYDDLYTYYYDTDRFPGTNKVWDMYSMDGQGNAAYYYYFNNDDECGTYSGEGDCYNREHSVPQSWFNSASPMVADLFMVYPTDGYVNNRRSNYPYGEVDNPSWTSTNGSKVGTNSFPGGPSVTVFEPIDDYKGDFARTFFYVATRYKNDIPNWDFSTNLQYVFNQDGSMQDWAVQMFMQWHEQDPVSQKELDRNDAAYNIQHNRNPFIDHPEWVECIWGNSCAAVLQFTSNPITSVVVGQQYVYNITASGEDTTAMTITCLQMPNWLNFQANYHTSAKLYGTPIEVGDYNVSLMLTDNTDTVYQNFVISVVPVGEDTVLITNDFDNCEINDWIIYSVSSNEDWFCSSSGYMYVNNYQADEPADDWLITPPLNLDNFTNEILNFDTYTRYSDTEHPRLKVYYSTDYDGVSNPNNFTWTELPYEYPAEDSQLWTNSGDIDLSGISGSNVYIGFRYTSSGTGAGTCELWELDNVVITARTDTTPDPGSNTLAFVSQPDTQAIVGELYQYFVQATADDTSALSIQATTIPEWLNFQSNYNTSAYLYGTPSQEGVYNVILQLTDGVSSVYQEFSIYVQNNNTFSAQMVENILIYPNPAKDFVNVEVKNAQNLKIYLYSFDGKVIKSLEFNNSTSKNGIIQINISDIDQNVLFLKVETANFAQTFKILKYE